MFLHGNINMKNRRTKSFNNIYKLATQDKREELQKYLAQPNIKIDCMDDLFTVAGRLAMEGNTEAAELLRELGANVDEIAYGAAYGFQHDYLKDLINAHDADNGYIVRGAVANLHFDLLDDLEEEFRDDHHFHIETGWIVEGLQDSGLFKDKETALFTFATKPYIYLDEEVRRCFSFDIETVQKQGENLKLLMEKYDLNFNQALAWQQDSVKIWLFQAKNIPTLMRDMITNIATYLAPITQKDASDLLEKTSLKYSQQFLSQDLKAYHRVIPHLFFNNSTDTSTKLLKSIETVKNVHELRNHLTSNDNVLKTNNDGHVKRMRNQQTVPMENQVLESILNKYIKRLSM